jgi:alpha-galactosidase
MQRWTMQFIPPELLGTHIGSNPGHQTGRDLSLAFRAATALFGHAGLERDLTALSQEELKALKSWIALYKRERNLLHSGEMIRMDYPDSSHYLFGVVDEQKSEGIFSYVQLQPIIASHAPKLFFRGLNAKQKYQLSVINEAGEAQLMAISAPDWLNSGAVMTGAALEEVGLPAPILRPENALLLKVKAV